MCVSSTHSAALRLSLHYQKSFKIGMFSTKNPTNKKPAAASNHILLNRIWLTSRLVGAQNDSLIVALDAHGSIFHQQ